MAGDVGARSDTLDARQTIKRCAECGQQYSPDSTFCPFDGSRLEPALARHAVDPLVGSIVDERYEVLQVIGEGGMGTVYSVRHTTIGRTFALKALRADLAREGDLSERFLREANTTASIKHPNVVSITDFGSLPDGRPYFVMERLVGQTLSQVIKRGGAMPAARGAAITVKVARALAAAHEAGVVHRDLKPDNVFLVGRSDAGPEQDVRVVDFGAAIVAGKSRLTRAGIVFGTPHYMSPEQASGAAVDHRADIYALGIIMYELFTGRVPFEGDTYMGVLTQHMFAQPLPPSRLEPGLARDLGALEAITLKCLEKQPEKRYATMEELAREVEGVLQVDADGRTTITPYLDAGESRGEPRIFAMADSLELPTAGELRGRVRHLSSEQEDEVRGRRARGVLAVGVVAVVGALGFAGWRASRAAPAPASSSAAPQASSAVPVLPALPSAEPAKARKLTLRASAPCDVYRGDALVGRAPVEVRVEADGATYVARAEGYFDEPVRVGPASPDPVEIVLRRRPSAPRATVSAAAGDEVDAAPPSGSPLGGPADPWK